MEGKEKSGYDYDWYKYIYILNNNGARLFVLMKKRREKKVDGKVGELLPTNLRIDYKIKEPCERHYSVRSFINIFKHGPVRFRI